MGQIRLQEGCQVNETVTCCHCLTILSRVNCAVILSPCRDYGDSDVERQRTELDVGVEPDPSRNMNGEQGAETPLRESFFRARTCLLRTIGGELWSVLLKSYAVLRPLQTLWQNGGYRGREISMDAKGCRSGHSFSFLIWANCSSVDYARL